MMANFQKFALNFVNDFMNIQEAIIVILERVLYTISIKKQQSQYKDTSVPPFLMSEYCKNNSVLLLLIGSPVFKKTGHHNFLYSCLSPLLLMVHRTPPLGLSVSLSSCIILCCPGNSVNSNSCSNRAISTRASN